jgi:hypothetical protein
LYNMMKDPGETENLAKTHPAILEQMQKVIADEQQRTTVVK